MKNRAEGRLPVDRIGHLRMQGCQHISLQHNFLLCFLMGSAMVFSANDTTPLRYPRLLTIAGSDSGGGAGIQADLKTFAALGCYGMSALTALTAQNTLGVRSIHAVPVEILADQIDAVAEDIGIDAVKIGMLHSAPTVETVAAALDRHALRRVVLDPVMVATSG